MHLPTLRRPGTLYLLVAEGAAASCQAWTVAPDAAGRGRLERDAGGVHETLDYEVQGHAVALLDDALGTGDSQSCDVAPSDGYEADDAVVVGGARWFRTAAACDDARAAHRRVAVTPALGCALDTTPDAARARTHARFDRLVARGGTLFALGDDACTPVRVVPPVKDGDGALEYDDVRDDGVRGTTGYDFIYTPGSDQITLLGPGTTWADGSGMAYG